MMEHWKFANLIPGPVGDALDKHFAERGWVLERRTDSGEVGYQVYFGADVQVDNLYECGFPHLYDEEMTVDFAEEFYRQHISTSDQTHSLRIDGGAL
ncbi:MAG: hypothetical protein Q3982_03045 [Phoenicibacter congonensis]|uniref:Uncharacterized protein n=1 Tax=Phoenicibacter congonensis TaxID=1944646 RepID=A0AA43U8X5_9ACTN|nr:hypothetical protein [Phoenicibacter congonensis]